jgi:hypothetical protein
MAGGGQDQHHRRRLKALDTGRDRSAQRHQLSPSDRFSDGRSRRRSARLPDPIDRASARARARGEVQTGKGRGRTVPLSVKPCDRPAGAESVEPGLGRPVGLNRLRGE